MLKRFSHFFASLLLVLMPLQGIAAANMSICNSRMHSQETESKQANMPCHEGMVKSAEKPTDNQAAKHQSQCKAACATLCASLCALTVLPSNIKPASFLASSALVNQPHQVYASITQPSLQRPPNLFS